MQMKFGENHLGAVVGARKFFTTSKGTAATMAPIISKAAFLPHLPGESVINNEKGDSIPVGPSHSGAAAALLLLLLRPSPPS